MSASAKRRLAALSEQLVAPIGDQGKFENIPILKKIAADSNGPRVKGKVVIVTGQSIHSSCTPILNPDTDYRNEFSSWHWSSFRTSVCKKRRESYLHL